MIRDYETTIKHSYENNEYYFYPAVDLILETGLTNNEDIVDMGICLGEFHAKAPEPGDGWAHVVCSETYVQARQMMPTCYYDSYEMAYWQASVLIMQGFAVGLKNGGIDIDVDICACEDPEGPEGTGIPDEIPACKHSLIY